MLPPIVALLAVASFAAAEITLTTYTIETCFTSYGPTAANVTSIPTSLSVSRTTGQGFARGTITPVVTVTPAVSTETSTSVTTRTVGVTAPSEAATGIETVTTTFTKSSVISSTETFTSIVSVNSTITLTATSTIPTQSNFTPVAADIIAQTLVPSRHKKNKKRWGPLNARNVFDRMLLEIPPSGGRGRGRGGGGGGNKCLFRHLRADPAQETGISLYPALYPASVECTQVVRVDAVRLYPKRGTVTSTVTAQASTTTSTATSTATATTTIGSVGSSAASTLTSSVTTVVESTTTLVSTTFSTFTNTITANAPVATEYAACAPNNTVAFVDKHPIAAGAQELMVLAEATSPKDCCEMCQMTFNCTTSAYYDGTGDCMLGNGAGAGTNQFFTTDDEDDAIFYISNGAGEPSGNWFFGGSLTDGD